MRNKMRNVTRFGVVAALLSSALLLMLAMPHQASYAQTSEPTGIIDAAFRDLSAKLGKPVVKGGDSTFSWEQTVFPDASLGCPEPGKVYAQTTTPGYKII